MSKKRIASAGLLALLAAGAAAQELHAPDATVGDRFGWSVAVSGERLLVGVLRDDDRGRDSGSAWVFELGDEGWAATEKLLASNGRVGAQFGHDVALSGDLAVLGAPGMGFQGERVGRAYVFERGPGGWTEVLSLVGEDAPADFFGQSVAVSGASVAVGAPRDDDFGFDAGAVYVWSRNGGEWQLDARVAPAGGAAQDHFGAAVALDGDRLVVGAPESDAGGTHAGAVYVLERSSLGTWEFTATLTGDVAFGSFGASLALAGDRLSVGSPGRGRVEVFERSASGAWIVAASLQDATAADGYGASVALHGNHMLAGTPSLDQPVVNSGSATAYGLDEGSWFPVETLGSDEPAGSVFLGHDVAIDGPHAVSGAYGSSSQAASAGAVFVFDPSLLAVPAEWWTPFCFCDEGPCDNDDPSGGCASSLGRGARLEAGGSPSLAAGDLTLHATDLPPRRPTWLFLGPAVDPQPFRSGIVCLQGRNLKSFGPRRSDRAGLASWKPDLVESPRACFTPRPPLAGETWTFQVIYVDRASPCHVPLNATHAVSVTLAP